MKKIFDRIAREIEYIREDPQDWAEFVTDCLCVIGVAFLAAFALFLMVMGE